MDGQMDNDTRGWIMTGISGVACVIGASIICVDVLVRLVWKNSDFQIEKSSSFLAASMSLSFGVMLFSALYSMLPSSKKYLLAAGYSASAASWILLATFIGGFVGIQIVSRFLHHYMPSHVETCDHTHKEGELEDEECAHEHVHEHHHDHDHRGHSHSSRGRRHHEPHPQADHHGGQNGQNGKVLESTPLLYSETHSNRRPSTGQYGADGAGHSRNGKPSTSRRPSMVQVQSRVLSFVKDMEPNCDGQGPCYGYSDPCGKGCFKQLNGKQLSARSSISHHTGVRRPSTGGQHHSCHPENLQSPTRNRLSHAYSHDSASQAADSEDDLESQQEHHHHVPDKAFMNLGIQTSIAIALHKLPEGFITYATNHVNPSLGFSVFMALFVHNITEGFALALPLFLATNSRMKAMTWASLLGGVSQPLGAGIAALWFGISGHQGHEPGQALYGGMFGITAGIMVSVALNLFVEGVGLNHNTNLCMGFAFLGMVIMGASNALTA